MTWQLQQKSAQPMIKIINILALLVAQLRPFLFQKEAQLAVLIPQLIKGIIQKMLSCMRMYQQVMNLIMIHPISKLLMINGNMKQLCLVAVVFGVI